MRYGFRLYDWLSPTLDASDHTMRIVLYTVMIGGYAITVLMFFITSHMLRESKKKLKVMDIALAWGWHHHPIWSEPPYWSDRRQSLFDALLTAAMVSCVIAGVCLNVLSIWEWT